MRIIPTTHESQQSPGAFLRLTPVRFFFMECTCMRYSSIQYVHYTATPTAAKVWFTEYGACSPSEFWPHRTSSAARLAFSTSDGKVANSSGRSRGHEANLPVSTSPPSIFCGELLLLLYLLLYSCTVVFPLSLPIVHVHSSNTNMAMRTVQVYTICSSVHPPRSCRLGTCA